MSDERLQELKHLADEARASIEYDLESAIIEATEAVVARMQELGLSRAELARRMGISPPMVTKLLRGENNFTLRTLISLARALDSAVAPIGFVPHGCTAVTRYVWRSPAEIGGGKEPTPPVPRATHFSAVEVDEALGFAHADWPAVRRAQVGRKPREEAA